MESKSEMGLCKTTRQCTLWPILWPNLYLWCLGPFTQYVLPLPSSQLYFRLVFLNNQNMFWKDTFKMVLETYVNVGGLKSKFYFSIFYQTKIYIVCTVHIRRSWSRSLCSDSRDETWESSPLYLRQWTGLPVPVPRSHRNLKKGNSAVNLPQPAVWPLSYC